MLLADALRSCEPAGTGRVFSDISILAEIMLRSGMQSLLASAFYITWQSELRMLSGGGSHDLVFLSEQAGGPSTLMWRLGCEPWVH
eukprot:1739740-Amphidinium_carterae.1